ncbi:phage shock protein C (PspC) family protein [Streptosporangium subroseum]|jgi:phage shock protein PspC (stress-responsive transcriptional regulator)|uniref:Phage shock protein C (PspC) family protein n=1 Tax=Streptosporangium subroseum TaxID=106412 RepID=A0A239NUU0_9ACTN|nr:phage shock protein C (PspC) family protein [Streptosporangium subroseum]
MKNIDSGRGNVHRSRNHKIIAGVCGGIADSLGWSPTVVRVLWLLLSLIPGPLWVAYVLMWIFVPKAPAARY